jgi:hypothetical protein
MLLRCPPRPTRTRRRAAVLAEAGLVYPLIALLTLGVTVLAMGVYYYFQVAALAREGARYASVHGGQYHQETGNAMATQSTVLSTAIVPKAAGFNTGNLSNTLAWDDAGGMPTYLDTHGNVLTNKVTVTVTYQWTPPFYFSQMTFTTTSVMTVQY